MVVLGGGRFLMNEASLQFLTYRGSEQVITQWDIFLSLSLKHTPFFIVMFIYYRGYSKLRTHTALRSYGRAIPRSIGPPQGRCLFLISSSPCMLVLTNFSRSSRGLSLEDIEDKIRGDSPE